MNANEQMDTRVPHSEAHISDQFIEGWERFYFASVLLPGQRVKKDFFFSWFYLILLKSWQGNRKLGKK